VYLVPFVHLFPEQAERETRVLTTSGYPGLPDDEYALVESYCADPTCNCRRVMLNVIARRQNRIMATISLGFDRKAEMAGPFLDPLNPQSRYAEVLLKAVSDILADPAYVARLERHYAQVKRVAANPTPAVRRTLARYMEPDEQLPKSRTRKRWRA
jgi:hypothetical protein